MSKYNNKKPKFKSGDILIHTNNFAEAQTVVILEERYDNNKNPDVAWWVYDYPDKKNRFAVPERELSARY